MTPELRPVWCRAISGSFSSTVTACPRRVSSYAVASPTMPAPATTTSATVTSLPHTHSIQAAR